MAHRKSKSTLEIIGYILAAVFLIPIFIVYALGKLFIYVFKGLNNSEKKTGIFYLGCAFCYLVSIGAMVASVFIIITGANLSDSNVIAVGSIMLLLFTALAISLIYFCVNYRKKFVISEVTELTEETEKTANKTAHIDYTNNKVFVQSSKSNEIPQENLNQSEPQYTKKDNLMTDCERSYFLCIKDIIGKNYMLQPQVNLATILDKNTDGYRNELFRNIDFGVFDLQYKLLLLIEINDKSHEQTQRHMRDLRIKEICEQANIPLIFFWTKYGINTDYIKKRLQQYIDL